MTTERREVPLDHKLKKLAEELSVSLELGDHLAIADLSSEMIIELVGLYDSLMLDQNDKIQETRSDYTSEYDSCVIDGPLIVKICDKLRSIGLQASAYNSVVDFVRLNVGSCILLVD